MFSNKIRIRELARKIWDYHHMNQGLKKADCILVLGSYDKSVPKYGASLFLEGWAPLMVFSGANGRHTEQWPQTEAETFANLAIAIGVPKAKILVENKATNTSENVIFTKLLLERQNVSASKFILVTKPYMERRAYATFKKVWPEKEVIVVSPQVSFDEYHDDNVSEDTLINIMLGDLQRIKVYTQKGFQIPQEIPTDIWSAFEELVALGYNKELII